MKTPPPGTVNFGDLRRLAPLSDNWGFDRGRPIDRVYIEAFLASHAADIRGRVASIGDDAYVRRFGGERVAQCDVIDVRPDNVAATIVADLADAGAIPPDAFDCFVCPQTLQFTFDVLAAVRTIHRVLKPGGVALVTVPGVSRTSEPEPREPWHWNFTPHSAGRLFECFPADGVEIRGHGNVLVAAAFLMGLAEGELRPEEIDHYRPGYEVVTTIRAVKGR
jgi:SAM-dependent methyltransferase